MACAPGRGITAWASPGIAGGFRCAGERLERMRTALARGAGLSVGRRARAAGRVTRRRGVGRVLGPCWRGGKTGAGRARLQAECGAGRARRGTGPWDAGALADRAAGVWLGWDGLGC